MHNLILSPIDPEILIDIISERITANILKAIKSGQPPTDQPEQLLAIDEVSKLLHLTKSTVYSKVSKNELPGVCKRGKRLYFDRGVIIDWIKEGRRKSNAELEQEVETYLSNNKKALK